MAVLAVDEVMLREPALLVPRRPPLGPVQIDWANPITRNLSCWIDNKSMRDLVARESYYSLGTRTKERGGSYASATNLIGPSWAALAAKNIGTADFTVGIVGIFSPTSADVQVAMCHISSTSQWRLQPAHTGAGGAAGAFTFQTYDGTFTSVGGTSLINGLLQCFIGVRRGTTHELWCDGRLAASATGTARTIAAGTGGEGVYTGSFGLNYYSSLGFTFAGFVLNRALAQGEAAAMSKDPYQVLIPA